MTTASWSEKGYFDDPDYRPIMRQVAQSKARSWLEGAAPCERPEDGPEGLTWFTSTSDKYQFWVGCEKIEGMDDQIGPRYKRVVKYLITVHVSYGLMKRTREDFSDVKPLPVLGL